MKPFWEDLFSDLKNKNLTEEEAAVYAGNEINKALDGISGLIRELKPADAIKFIEECKKDF